MLDIGSSLYAVESVILFFTGSLSYWGLVLDLACMQYDRLFIDWLFCSLPRVFFVILGISAGSSLYAVKSIVYRSVVLLSTWSFLSYWGFVLDPACMQHNRFLYIGLVFWCFPVFSLCDKLC